MLPDDPNTDLNDEMAAVDAPAGDGPTPAYPAANEPAPQEPAPDGPTPDERLPLYFRLFNEMGIIAQLSGKVLEGHLPDGLLQPHFGVLNHLSRVGDGRTLLAMAQAFQVPKTTMSHQVGVLARHNLVRLAPNPDDGRSKRVWLTDEGRTLRERIVHGFGDEVARWSETITPDEVAALMPRLERIRRFLDADRDQPHEAATD